MDESLFDEAQLTYEEAQALHKDEDEETSIFFGDLSPQVMKEDIFFLCIQFGQVFLKISPHPSTPIIL